METTSHPVKEKIRRLIYILSTTIGWMIFGLTLGFGAMWLSGSFMYSVNDLFYDTFIPFSVFGLIITVMAILIRLQQRRQGATVGDYWRLVITLIVCMGVGAYVFLMVDSLLVIIPYY